MNESTQKTSFFLWAEVTAFSLILMEVLWVSLWYETLLDWRMPWISVEGILFILTLSSYLLARGINVIKMNPWLRLAAYVPWAIVCLLMTLKIMVYPNETIGLIELVVRPIRTFLININSAGEFWHMLIILALVARATSLARRPVDLWDALRSFQIGLLMLLFFGVGYAFTDRTQSILPVYGFIFFGLVAMITARISTISVLRGGRLPRLSRAWWSSIFTASLLVVALGIFTGWVFSGSIGAIIGFITKVFLGIIATLIFIILTPLIPLFQLFADWIKNRAIELFPSQTQQVLQQIIDEMQKTSKDANNKLLEWLMAVSPWVLGFILLLILLYALTELGWLPWKRLLPGESETENLKPGFPLRRLFRPPQTRQSRANPSRLLAAARIRRIYGNLLNLSEKLGKARLPAITPLEFLPALVQLFPTHVSDLELITQAYNQIRYGQLPESDDEVQQVIQAWESVQAEGKQMLAQKKLERKRPLI